MKTRLHARQPLLPALAIPLPLVAVAALALPAATPAQAAQAAGSAQVAQASHPHFPASKDLQVMLHYLVEDGETPGIVLGMVETDGSIRFVSAGDPGPDARPLGLRSVFEIGSINKTFTGTLLALAVERGEARLDDPVAKHLPEHVTVPSRDGREITLLDLATHRSGLPRLPGNMAPADPGDPYADYTVDMLYEFLSGHELRRDPGAEAEYSNLGFGLLGHALARAAGTSYVDLVRERILEPLGMTMTGYELEGDMAEWTTKGHRAGDVVPYWHATEAIQGAGGLRSTMEDMLLYLHANLDPPDSELGRAMRAAREVRSSIGQGGAIGLGWQVRNVRGRTIVQHGGGTGGYNTHIAFDPELGAGTVLLTNTTQFQDDIDRDILIRGLPLSVANVEVPRATLARYAGTYEFQPGQPIHIRLEDDGTLTLQVLRNVRFRLHADSETSFVAKRTPWRVTFSTEDDGSVSRLLANFEGGERAAYRVGADSPDPMVVAGNRTLDLPLDVEAMAPYVGNYTLRMGEQALGLRIYVEGADLFADPADARPPTRLRYQGDHAFIPEADAALRLEFTVENGRAERVTLIQGAQRIPGERTP